MFAEEFIFHVEPTTVTLFPNSVYKVALRTGVIAQQLRSHAFLFDTGAERNIINKFFLKSEGLPNVNKQ